MADQSHRNILAQGVETWNSWRARNPSVTPDLHGAILHRADLRGVNLRGARLSFAQPAWADLRWVDLRGAELSEAIMPDVSRHP
jgi:uncharacterized protein YjbI with pentapeptide repeats